MKDFIKKLDDMIMARRKITNPLYQVIMDGQATKTLLQNFVIHRFPIKNFWTRNILGIAARIDDYDLRRDLVSNIYEEETGKITNSKRHLQTFIDFGKALELSEKDITNNIILQETQEVINHNISACNDTSNHFTMGVSSVLLLMEGQPPIRNQKGISMLKVMQEIYQLPPEGYEFFVHHASNVDGGVSDLEDEHAETAKEILIRYCNTKELQEQAVSFLERAIYLRHKHFDAIYKFYNPHEKPFRYQSMVKKNVA